MSHDRDLFLRLFLANQQELSAFLLARGIAPDLVDDVLQDVAVVLWRKFDQFDPDTNFRAWAFTVTKYEWKKTLSRLSPHSAQRSDHQVIAMPEAVLDHVEAQLLETQHDYSRLHFCLERLGDFARDLIDRYYHQGQSSGQICQDLSITAGALRTRLSRIRQALSTCLGSHER